MFLEELKNVLIYEKKKEQNNFCASWEQKEVSGVIPLECKLLAAEIATKFASYFEHIFNQ